MPDVQGLLVEAEQRQVNLFERLGRQQPMGDTRMIKALAEQVSSHPRTPDRGTLTQRYMLMWHAFSGSVHGYQWQDKMAAVVDVETGTRTIGNFLDNLIHLASAVEDALVLYRHRAGDGGK